MNKKLSFPIGAVLLLVTTVFNLITLISNLANPYMHYTGLSLFLVIAEILTNAFLGISLLTANFRRKIADFVEETDEYTFGAGHRPARLFRKKITI